MLQCEWEKLFWLISLWVRFVFVTSFCPGIPFHLIVSLTRYTFQATFCGLHAINSLENQISSSSEVSVKDLVVSLVVFFPHSPTWTFVHFSCFILYATDSIKSVHMLVPSCLVFRQGKVFHKSLCHGPQAQGICYLNYKVISRKFWT